MALKHLAVVAVLSGWSTHARLISLLVACGPEYIAQMLFVIFLFVFVSYFLWC